MKIKIKNGLYLKILWFILFVFSLISVIFIFLKVFHNYVGKREEYLEKIIFPFYVSNISLFFSFFISILMFCNILKNKINIEKKIIIFNTINSFEVILMFWLAFIFKKDYDEEKKSFFTNEINSISTILLHVIVPFLSIIIFFIWKNKNIILIKKKSLKEIFKNSFFILIIPTLWNLIIGIPFYYFLESKPNKDTAIYFFLDFNKNGFLKTILYFFIIYFSYFTITSFTNISLNYKNLKQIQKRKKIKEKYVNISTK